MRLASLSEPGGTMTDVHLMLASGVLLLALGWAVFQFGGRR